LFINTTLDMTYCPILRPALIEALRSLDPRSGSTISGFVQSWRSAAQGSDLMKKVQPRVILYWV